MSENFGIACQDLNLGRRKRHLCACYAVHRAILISILRPRVTFLMDMSNILDSLKVLMES